MTSPPTAPAPGSGPLGPVSVVAALIAVVAWVLASVRPWGDTGVEQSTGALHDARPALLIVCLGGVVVVTALVAVAAVRHTGRFTSAGLAALAGGLIVAVVVVGSVAVLAVTSAQVFPRDGGWWAIVAVMACGLSGLAVALSGTVRPAGRRAQLVAATVAFAVPAALVVVAGVVAPGWSTHVVDGSSPASFSESPGPATVTRVGWTASYGSDTTVAVLGGRVVVATDSGGSSGGRHCRLSVKALDAGTGKAIWSSSRPLRCDGPRLAALDGNNTTVRVTLRGSTRSGGELEGAPVSIYLGLEDGRGFTPSSALDAVQWWTEGFGLVADGASVRGLDARTGATLWTRPLPTCPDGTIATLQLPGALQPGAPASRSPYDLGLPFGSAPVVSAGNDVVLATSCGTVRQVWFVDALRGAGADRTLDLPIARDAGDAFTTFLPWLDTVVVSVPTDAATDGTIDAALVGIDITSGKVVWQRAAAPLSTVTLSPVDGSVQVSSTPPSGTATTAVLDVHTGKVLAEHDDPAPPETSVALTGGRVQSSRSGEISVVDPKTGVAIGNPFSACPPDRTSTAAPMLAGPGGVVLRCAATASSGPSLLGLAP